MIKKFYIGIDPKNINYVNLKNVEGWLGSFLENEQIYFIKEKFINYEFELYISKTTEHSKKIKNLLFLRDELELDMFFRKLIVKEIILYLEKEEKTKIALKNKELLEDFQFIISELLEFDVMFCEIMTRKISKFIRRELK